MPSEPPTLASCPHCRTILLRTRGALVHPMSGERDRIIHALGRFWFDHSQVRFDGRFHRCTSLERVVVKERKERKGGRDGDCHRPWLIAAFLVMLVPCSVRAQEILEQLLREGVPNAVTAPEASALRSVPSRFPVLKEPSSVGPRGPARAHASANPPRAGVTRTLGRHRKVPYEVPSEPGLEPPEDDPANGRPPEKPRSWLGSELADGRYQVVDTIRKGNAGEVYLAHDRNLDTHVVVEVPRVADPEAAPRLVCAAKTLARLEHPNLVKVTAVGTFHEAPFVVTEHLSGGSLKFRRPVGPDGRPLPAEPSSLRDWLVEVAGALDYLHSQDRVYRGLGPSSVLFDAQGRAYLGGLGVSSALAPASPAGASTDVQADQHALAATVYEMLSGRRPEVDSARAPLALERVCPSVPPALSSVVDRGLSSDPHESFHDCRSFARAVLLAARSPAASNPARLGRGAGASRSAEHPNHPSQWVSLAAVVLAAVSPRMLELGAAGAFLVLAAVVWGLRRHTAASKKASAPPRPHADGALPALAAVENRTELAKAPGVPDTLAMKPHAASELASTDAAHRSTTWRSDSPIGPQVLGHPSPARDLALRADPEVPAGRTGWLRVRRLLPPAFSIPPVPQLLRARRAELARRKAS